MLAFLSTILSFVAFLMNPVSQAPDQPVPEHFKDYWYQGEAEITSYELEQARYAEIRKGHAVLIFVTEEFSKEKQVKLDNPYDAPKDAVRVMKLNNVRKFNTGIYPYSMMTSVFSPVDPGMGKHPLKLTVSSQEWCGHTFQQFNKERDEYEVHQFSYFESEGDKEYDIPVTWLEDEIWNLIRIKPEALPTGDIKIVPGLLTARLTHQPAKPVRAEAALQPGDSINEYMIRYPVSNRTLKIRFQKDFPHEIESWEETFTSGFGPNVTMLTTRATKIEREMLAYWKLNSTNDDHWRTKLGLPLH